MNKTKNKIIKTVTVTVAILALLINYNKVNAQEADIKTESNNNLNLETMIDVDRDEHIRNILKAIYNSDNTYVLNNTYLFTEDVYDELLNYTENNNINSNDIGDMVIDCIDVKNSDTGDYVIMANAKIWYDNQQYNKLYLFEFHVNYEGRIYGYNVWVY